MMMNKAVAGLCCFVRKILMERSAMMSYRDEFNSLSSQHENAGWHYMEA
jgi:hypothetical protein